MFSLNNQQWQVRLRFVGQVKSGTEAEHGPRNDQNGDQNEEVKLVWILEVWSLRSGLREEFEESGKAMKTITKIIPDASPEFVWCSENLHLPKCGLEFLWQLHYGAINLFSVSSW